MGFLNAILGPIFVGLLKPFGSLPAWVPLAVLALISSVGVLFVYKKVSNQAGIDRTKRHIHACFYEIRLFNDDLRAILRAQGEILRYNAVYVALNMVPLFVMIIPFTLVIAQLQSHYGWDGLRPGDSVLVKARLAEGWEQGHGIQSSGGKPTVTLSVPEGMSVETASVWIPSQREFAWRVSASGAGEHEIAVRVGDQEVSKQVFVAGTLGRRSPARQQAGFAHQLLFPGEAVIPDESPIHSIEIEYPDGSLDLFGWKLHSQAGIPAWMIVYFLLSMAFALALKDRFGVSF
jgi:hypothetical protein